MAIALKLNKLMLNEGENTLISKLINEKLNVINVVTFYSITRLYKVATSLKSCFCYIERCFPMVVETQNFLHLDFCLVAKILSSSELNILTEVEVFNAAITWLKHNSKERSKYVKHLLLKVRFTLLSEHALKYIWNCFSLISKNQECSRILKEVYINCLNNKSNSCYTNRYCGQNTFNFLIFGGYISESNNVVNTVNQIKGSDLNKTNVLPSMTFARRTFEAVFSRGQVYVFGGRNDCGIEIMTVEKYSPFTNKWCKVTHMRDKRQFFCACAFIDEIYVFGGHCRQNYEAISSCLQFDTREKNWKRTARMNEARESAACVVFQGNILVSGGYDTDQNELNTVESYDAFADEWTSMPNTIDNYSYHSLVAIRDKLYVIGNVTYSVEVFDIACKVFIALKPSPAFIHLNKAFPVGNKIVIFQETRRSQQQQIICFDVDKYEWSEELCEVTKHLEDFSCLKIPLY